jgi:hypothetical protein
MVGTTVMNRFEIGEVLGSGGFGTVYRAWDLRLEREVAVKVVETGPGSGTRTRREAQAAARLNHPGIVTLFEFVHHELGPEGGRAFLVSELVEGRTVRELIDRDMLSDREIGEIGIEVASSLDHAHSRGVVHRDLKPSNLISPDGTGGAKLMDFGVARLTDLDELTRTGDVLGTLAYMAPEQAEGREAGPPADVFALGLVLFEALTGLNPRKGSTPSETVRALDRDLPPISAYRPDLPVELADLIDECLELDPDHRPTASELADGIGRTARQLDTARPDGSADLGSGARFGTLVPGGPWLARAPLAILFGASVAVGMSATYAQGVSAAGSVAVDYASIGLGALIVGLATLVRPRLGFLTGVVGLAAWLLFALDLPGAALGLALVGLPVALVVRGEGWSLGSVPLAPAAGLIGLAPGIPFLAAAGRDFRERAAVALAALATTAFLEAATGRKLLAGDIPRAGDDWAGSTGAFLSEILIPTLTTPSVLVTAVVWVVIAGVTGYLVDRIRHRKARFRQHEDLGAAVGSEGVHDVV